MLLPIVDFGLVVLIWMTQLIVYPNFTFMREVDLIQWHRKYTTSITIVVMPLMLAQVGLHLFTLITDFNVLRVIAALLIVAIWINTFFKMVPIHNKIAQGIERSENVHKLVAANWFRTVSWSLVFILDLAIMINDRMSLL